LDFPCQGFFGLGCIAQGFVPLERPREKVSWKRGPDLSSSEGFSEVSDKGRSGSGGEDGEKGGGVGYELTFSIFRVPRAGPERMLLSTEGRLKPLIAYFLNPSSSPAACRLRATPIDSFLDDSALFRFPLHNTGAMNNIINFFKILWIFYFLPLGFFLA
jgi:hypothetical protein